MAVLVWAFVLVMSVGAGVVGVCGAVGAAVGSVGGGVK